MNTQTTPETPDDINRGKGDYLLRKSVLMVLSMLESDEKSQDAKKALNMAWNAVKKLDGFDVSKS